LPEVSWVEPVVNLTKLLIENPSCGLCRLLIKNIIINHNSRDSRGGPRSKITQKPASIFPDNNGAVLVR